MTKLPSEAFLPTGALDWDLPSAKASVLRHSNMTGSNTNSNFTSHPNHPVASPGSHYRPHVYGIRPSDLSRSHAEAFAKPEDFGVGFVHRSNLSPGPSAQRRSSSLSPTARSTVPSLSSHKTPVSRAIASAGGVGSSLLRSVSADAAAPQQTSVHLVQRLTQQNALIREAWEAERNYLEANRRRAEEVYQEEREIMEDVRETWENERAAMATEIQTLKERIQRLEGENATLMAVASQSVQLSGLVSPNASQPAISTHAPTKSSQTTATPASVASTGLPGHPGLPGISGLPGLPGLPRLPGFPQRVISPPITGPSRGDTSMLPPGLDGASRRPHHASPGGSRTSPTAQPETSPFITLEPRTQPQNSSPHDFLSTSSDDVNVPTPIIDVQEIDPKLEGIPIKATAVQKPTFSEPSDQPSPATSPSADPSRPMPIKRGSSKDHTLQVLAAEESRRLTMHAGHTPNHSLSLFPTINATENNNTNGPSEGTTPTADAPSAPGERLTRLGQTDEPDVEEAEPRHPSITDPNAPLPLGAEEGPEPHLDPVDDVPLKGPLMVKNIPAQDELFWAQVNKKLEPISQGQNALPTVVRASLEDHQDTGPNNIPVVHQQPPAVAPVGGDASHDERPETADEDDEVPRDSKRAEPDVPLKLKTTTNFGAPFGVA